MSGEHPLPLSAAALQEIDTCVHCGLCLPSCPTYRELGQEPDSPRGRIYLVKAAHEGRLDPGPALYEHLDLCLGCLACQSACPSGVGYGTILEEARAHLEPERPRPPMLGWLRRYLLRRVLPEPARLRRLARLAEWGRRLRLHRLAAALRLMPRHLVAMADLIPPVRRRAWEAGAAGGGAEPGPRAGLLRGCVQEVLFPETNAATRRLLARRGVAVEEPATQTCCGALHAHAGDAEMARQLARRNVGAFGAGKADYIVVNAAGCGAHMKRYGHLLHDDPDYAVAAAEFSRRVRDLTELLADLAAAGRTAPATVAAGDTALYQDPCHLAHGQRVRQPPRRLLAGVDGLALAELGDDACCGSAGFYNLTEHEMSLRVLDRKMQRVCAAGARILVTANPGCLLQMRLGARRAGLDLEVLHIADLLDRAESACEPVKGDGQHG